MVTTISLSEEMKEKIRNLGRAGESYDDIIRRMYEISRKQILLNHLYDTADSVSIDEAIGEAKRRWPKSS
jgi:predicted CopG family antitoxin